MDAIVKGRLFAAIMVLLVACDPPDEPPTSTGDLPPSAVAYLQPGSVSTFELEAGVTYRSIRSRALPWVVHLIEVDAWRCDLGFRVARAGGERELTEVTELARRRGPGVIAAVNGDFFTPEGDPLGVEVSEGALRGTRSRPVLAWKPGELPWIGPVDWAGDSVRVGDWAVSDRAPDPDAEMVAGFPLLLSEGAVVGDLEVAARPDWAGERHPRTAVGLDSDLRTLWLVVVDGRREGAAEGMSLPELAGLLRALGADNALNLDGGGSSVMVIRGATVSHPADPTGERPVANALILTRDRDFCIGAPRTPTFSDVDR
jgi:hypothetical protein